MRGVFRSGAAALCAAILPLLGPGAAAALSCRQPDVAESFQAADAATDTYIIVLGELDFDTARLPKGGQSGRKNVRIPAQLHGRVITSSDFSDWIDRQIALDIQCVSAWCGAVPSGEDMLMFLRQSGARYVLDVGPCPRNVFFKPDHNLIFRARQCLSGGPCESRGR